MKRKAFVTDEGLSRRSLLRGIAAAGGAVVAGQPLEVSLSRAARAEKNICDISPGSVNFTRRAVVASNASKADEAVLIRTIKGLWKRYLGRDLIGVQARLTPEVIRQSNRGAGRMQQDAAAVAADLPSEWAAFELIEGVIAEQWTIRNAELWVDSSGTSATAVYWANIEGGSRWCYTDRGLILHGLTKVDGDWKVCHWIESYGLDVDLETGTPGTEAFSFDFSYPVTDLIRAQDFYDELLGPAEHSTSTAATYLVNSSFRFSIEKNGMSGLATVTENLANGWATIYVSDVITKRAQLLNAGTKFLLGTETVLLSDGPDHYVIAVDKPNVTKNPFIIKQRNYSTNGPPPVIPAGLEDSDPAVVASKRITSAWVGMQPAIIDDEYGSHGRWFDDTRTRARGFEPGPGLGNRLSNVYWPRYDRSSAGLSVNIIASSVRVRALGARTIVSYSIDMTGKGAHPFRETAFVTHVFDADLRPLISMTIAANRPAGMSLGLDYTGYPSTKPATVGAKFYTNVMELGTPYVDVGYRGWWSASGLVFGLYRSGRRHHGTPRPNKPSGYISFWVASAKDAYDWLQSRGSAFPLITAINSKSGVDRQPGYNQVLATDSEGNLLVCTEYTGR